MSQYQWDQEFLDLFERCVDLYRKGNTDFSTYYTGQDLAFLDSIGYRQREFFDFVEDYADDGEPSPGTALLVASARRDYFRVIQGGKRSEKTARPGDLPGKREELAGYPWLPRIIMKAEAKLRGELDPDIMFGCGGDRAFLREHDLHPAEFLRTVWAANGDPQPVIDFVARKTS